MEEQPYVEGISLIAAPLETPPSKSVAFVYKHSRLPIQMIFYCVPILNCSNTISFGLVLISSITQHLLSNAILTVVYTNLVGQICEWHLWLRPNRSAEPCSVCCESVYMWTQTPAWQCWRNKLCFPVSIPPSFVTCWIYLPNAGSNNRLFYGRRR